jgi:hypothetical protein
MLAGIDVVHIPYKGVPAALTDLMAGRVHYLIGSPISTLPHVKEGRLRLVAVTTPSRSPALPDVPTVAETLPGYEFTGWMGFLAPAKVSRAIVDKLNRETVRIVRLARDQTEIAARGRRARRQHAGRIRRPAESRNRALDSGSQGGRYQSRIACGAAAGCSTRFRLR